MNFLAALAFLNALITGKASFYIHVKGVRYQVALTNNGVATAPHLNAITQLTNAVVTAALQGPPTGSAKVGNNDWSFVVTPA